MRTLEPLAPKSQEESESGGDEESGEEDEEYGRIHIVNLNKSNEPLGIQLTHYTSPEDM